MDKTPNIEQASTNETAVQQKLAAMFAANDDKITIPKIYIDMVNDIEAAAVLDEIMFWTLPKKSTGKTSLRVRKEGKLWLAVRRADWWERKRLTERQSDRAIEKLIAAGMVEKQVWNFNGKPTVHLRLIMAKFIQAYTDHLKKTIETDEPELLQDIADLYAMMGFPPSPNGNLPNGEGPSPNGDVPSPNGEIINSLHTTTTTALGGNPPAAWGIGWQLAAGVEHVELMTPEQELETRVVNACDLFPQEHRELVRAFVLATGIFPIKSDVSGWCRAFGDQKDRTGLSPEDITSACQKMSADRLTIKGPFSVVGVAGSLHTENTKKAARDEAAAEAPKPLDTPFARVAENWTPPVNRPRPTFAKRTA